MVAARESLLDILRGYVVESLVRVTAPQPRASDGTNFGTAFFVAPGLAVTAAHVVGSAKTDIRVAPESGETVWKASVVETCDSGEGTGTGRRPTTDLAVLRVPEAAEAVPCVRLGGRWPANDAPLFAVGFATGREQNADRTGAKLTAAGGPESQRLRGAPTIAVRGDQLRPGMSGSPLLVADTGFVYGIVTRSRDTTASEGGYAFPYTALREILSPAVWRELIEAHDLYHHEQFDRWPVQQEGLHGDPETRVLQASHAVPFMPPVLEAELFSLLAEADTAGVDDLLVLRHRLVPRGSTPPVHPDAALRDLAADLHDFSRGQRDQLHPLAALCKEVAVLPGVPGALAHRLLGVGRRIAALHTLRQTDQYAAYEPETGANRRLRSISIVLDSDPVYLDEIEVSVFQRHDDGGTGPEPVHIEETRTQATGMQEARTLLEKELLPKVLRQLRPDGGVVFEFVLPRHGINEAFHKLRLWQGAPYRELGHAHPVVVRLSDSFRSSLDNAFSDSKLKERWRQARANGGDSEFVWVPCYAPITPLEVARELSGEERSQALGLMNPPTSYPYAEALDEARYWGVPLAVWRGEVCPCGSADFEHAAGPCPGVRFFTDFDAHRAEKFSLDPGLPERVRRLRAESAGVDDPQGLDLVGSDIVLMIDDPATRMADPSFVSPNSRRGR